VVVALIFGSSYIPAAASAARFEFSASANEKFSEAVKENISKDQGKVRNYAVTKIICSIGGPLSSKQINGKVSLIIDDSVVSTQVTGTFTYFDSVDGYVGVLDGTAKINGKTEQITLDIVYHNDKDNFTAVTIGCAGDIVPQIVFFGEYSSAVSKISELNVKKILAEKSAVLPECERDFSQKSIDDTLRFQSTDTKVTSGYETVTISLYHQNELRAQSAMPVYAKVNSHTASFAEYLEDVHGYDQFADILLVFPDKYMIEILGGDSYLHTNRTISPTAGATSQSITFTPYIPGIGYTTLGLFYTMTSTAVSYRAITVNPVFDDNIVTWNVHKNHGWSISGMDGYYDDPAGGVVRAVYTYSTSVRTRKTALMAAFGQMRYEIIYTPFQGYQIVTHMWTEEALCANWLTIIP
jgi:Ni,Fe-hydrogenase maturation factor